ncbi:uncharacterized protein LOC126904482 isoform X2 [Daktulosphaira vitifoliae]|uniref:uncharacterized protein LOC126904482 isoform X2 n=1 Tax=Daktulosphaira vitifoliae TaxID=58002 RepID=UPI0021A9FEEC|nr:uncharacterized protein LOC126904482 isoform X2 [Daktulosphaira vitifoliae]
MKNILLVFLFAEKCKNSLFNLKSAPKICTCLKIDMNNITHDVAKEHIYYHEKLLLLKIDKGTVYTSDQVSVKNFEEIDLNDDIDNPVPLDEEYLGSAPRLFYRTPVVGRTLREITDQAIQEYNDPMEAIVWLRNVIESMGITMLIQYSVFTANTIKFIPKEHEKFSHHFNEASIFFNFLSEKFRDYRLRREPIDQIILIFNEYNQSPKLEEDKQKFIKLSNDFSERFKGCIFLVEMTQNIFIRKVFYIIRSNYINILNVISIDITYFYNILLDTFYSYIACNAQILKGKQ